MRFEIEASERNGYSFLGLFSGTGGLDLGFELAGFTHTESNEILPYCVETLNKNRPKWKVIHGDIHEYEPKHLKGVDVLLAGFPCQGKTTTIKEFIYDLGQGLEITLPNHKPDWKFSSYAHKETNEPFDPNEDIVPIRISRTASDGYPVRKFDEPFPAVDTATVWGWAQGNVKAVRLEKDRGSDIYIRNPKASVTLWRITASRMRVFTPREFARLQTFPDSWEFIGKNKREVQLQIGNAVPVNFAKTIAENIKEALEVLDGKRENMKDKKLQFSIF